ncbi:MAG: D-alanyl-D-alanine carboxypeptidase/D-alanyl-D-alanine-endopeptidase [Muribaculaceae bacterium]|nr:D-alanyl-D-alanine carboxypeptidase/D-alanyl-D-alanine-endopeptidase [Muribaculaceae bacterium]
MKRQTLLLFILLASSLAFAASPIDRFLKSKSISAPASAVLIQDLKTGEVLASHNTRQPLLPASIMKTVTIAGLLNEKGPDERFHTMVYADGPIEGNTIDGDLLIVGGGDPTLGADCAPESADIAEELIAALRHKGIEKINGDIRLDISLYEGPACPPSWATADLHEAYGTGSHALNFRRNASGSRAVRNPESVFLSYLASRLSGAGIAVKGGVKTGTENLTDKEALLLLDHVSDTYAEVMRSCMMRSDNLFAENLLRAFGLARGREGSTTASADEMLSYWKKAGIPTQGVTLIDGSGLSRANRVTADFINGILRRMGDNEEYASFMPLAGQEGTLSKFLKDTPLDAYVAMKTGSMNGIQCYAGYKLDEEFAPTHSIVIIMNEIGPRASARKAAENLLLDIFGE